MFIVIFKTQRKFVQTGTANLYSLYLYRVLGKLFGLSSHVGTDDGPNGCTRRCTEEDGADYAGRNTS